MTVKISGVLSVLAFIAAQISSSSSRPVQGYNADDDIQLATNSQSPCPGIFKKLRYQDSCFRRLKI